MKFLATVLVALSFGAQANECAKDAQKFCSSVDPGKGQLARCLKDYQSQLSPGCSKELKDYKAKTDKLNPCHEDLAEFCADIPVDPRKIAYCLLKNESKLSTRCSADFKQKKSKLTVQDVCAQDIVNNCYSTISDSEAAITRCLIKSSGKLSGFCQKNVDKKIAQMKKNNPCFEETEKYCPTQTAFVDIHNCMEKKLNVLTPNCRKEVQKEIDKEKASPCYMDLRKHCKPGISTSDQHRCLTLNEKELSNSCRQFRIVEAEKLKKMVEVCEADRLKLCPKAPFQNGMVLKCLKENISKVTPSCKSLLQ